MLKSGRISQSSLGLPTLRSRLRKPGPFPSWYIHRDQRYDQIGPQTWGTVYVTRVEWTGPTWKPISVPWNWQRDGVKIPYRMMWVEDCLYSGSSLFVRVDGWRSITWFYRFCYARFSELGRWIWFPILRLAQRRGIINHPWNIRPSVGSVWKAFWTARRVSGNGQDKNSKESCR